MEILNEVGMPENIKNHSMQVNRVAMFLAGKLREKGFPVNMRLVDAASLLHDIDKHYILQYGDEYSHGAEGARMLEEMGYPEVAPVVRKHVLCNLTRESLDTWEEKIVHYADMRVTRDRIVPLEERIDYIRKRYGKDPARLENINRSLEPLLAVEREILEAAGIGSDEIQNIQT